jgi:hypothetical protein
MSNRVVGKCSLCGGVVTMPESWMSVDPPSPQCQKCHAVKDDTDGLPVIPMKPVVQGTVKTFRTRAQVRAAQKQ